MLPRLLRVAVVVVACGLSGYFATRRPTPHVTGSIWPDASLVHVPHLRGTINLDGDTDDSGWKGPVLRTGAFVGRDGQPVHPYSEARVVWGDGFLYMNLYAADEDIQVRGDKPDSLSPDEDVFHVVLTDPATERTLDFNALGVVTDALSRRDGAGPPDVSWDSHVHVSHELDGTPNKPHDNDEEWVLEVAIPLESLGLTGKPGEQLGLSMHRCDTPHSGRRVCGSWGGPEAHHVLVFDAPMGPTGP